MRLLLVGYSHYMGIVSRKSDKAEDFQRIYLNGWIEGKVRYLDAHTFGQMGEDFQL